MGKVENIQKDSMDLIPPSPSVEIQIIGETSLLEVIRLNIVG